ncbi:hypothetical protein [Lichenicola sp.]|uniref:hypothetical protein n=1 Tax=Lichenicola sp. TaxID=2804529 RepID=UPI003B00F53F
MTIPTPSVLPRLATSATPAMLIVLHAFGRYGRGDRIEDPVTIRAILAGGNANLVVVSAPLPAIPATVPTAEH